MANENRAYQLITEYHEEQRKLTIHREVDDEKTLTSYLHQIEALEASFEARLALWREERECLDTALSDAKQRFKKAQEEIHEIEQTLSLVSKREEKLQQNLRDEQERLVDGWTKSGHETFLERPRVDFDRCRTLIGNLVCTHPQTVYTHHALH